ncbi:tail fiber domain-containing protein [Candidatus Sodalis sp. SoCistrobi]|uniref:tail fiber domain-containing protein n=1 Tax=Candidatus Sodalis sp. SoCistrobi TaxID=1922216 RepID=UPI00093DDFB7|nr:tail fiber domain-containing protein [Candidatus Sodalis sp. SoCistrobi]
MAWYKTGTLSIAANSKKATGHGTRWADNKQGIGPGQMLLLPGTGTVALYEIASVVSDTELLLVSGPPKAVKEASYAIVTYNGGSYVDFGRELSAQLRYYQRQMDGWQQIMTGEGEVTLEAPDGTQVTLSSFKKLTADIASKVDKSELEKKADKSELENKADKSALEGKLDKTGGTVTGALHFTHSVNVGDVDSGLIANGDGSVALYAQGVKTGEWNTNRLHWVQNLEVGGNLTASGGVTFGKAVSLSGGGHLTGTLHFNGKGRSGGEQRSASLQYNPYAGGNMRTEFYSTDIINDHFEHRLILAKGNDLKWFVFRDDGNAYAQQGHWQNNSDRRIKSDIEKIENGLAKVETLTGYTYVLAKNRQAGVMADELEKVLPEAVSNSGDYHENDGSVVKNVKAIAYGSISALLIEAIKDLSAKVKAQQVEIDALKASMSTVSVEQDADNT